MKIDVASAMREVIAQCGRVKDDVLVRPEIVVLAKAVGLIAVAVVQQEERLRALETR